MKKSSDNFFIEYYNKLEDSEAQKINQFFSEFNTHCLLRKAEKKKMRQDFEKAILHYANLGISLEKVLCMLDAKYLGGFYARPSGLWFALDDAAKIYPLSMEHGRMAVFRLSVYLKEEVVPEILQMALNFTIKRFPGFATTLKKGVFWHYLDTTKRRFCIEKENDIPCQPLKVARSGSQSFRVLYYNNRISVEFFHVLTDGSGGMTFLKVLVAEYIRLLGEMVSSDETLWDINDVPDAEEFENAFTKVDASKHKSGFIDKPATQMNGKLTDNKPCRIIHFKMDALELKAAAKRYNTTVTIYLLSLMFLAGKAATDDLHGEASIQVPVNMRKFYPTKTVRNFSMYCGIRIPIEKIGQPSEIIDEISRQLSEKTSEEKMKEMITSAKNIVSSVRYIPLVVKQPAVKLVYGFLDDNLFTNTLSNLGVVKMPESVSKHIESMDFVLGTATINRAKCSLVTFNDTATFSIAKLTVDPSFEEKMYDLLCMEGIEVRVEGSDLYAN